jgi:3-phosphoshikimate 1-carboxyvinyltransferase
MSATPSRLVVHPGPGLGGSVVPPGDKSITHRAYILGALAEGETVVIEPNRGADCESTLACVAALGAEVRREADRVRIGGRGMRLAAPREVLDCGNSGTTLRLLAGPLAAQPFHSALSGDASLRRRPVDRIIEPLRRMGARLSAREGDRLPPLDIEGGSLNAVDHVVASNSAQVASCVLLAGLFAPGTTTVWLGPARDHTQRMLPAFGASVNRHEGEEWVGAAPTSVTGPQGLRATTLRVPRDFSGAAFFLVAAAARPGESVTARGVSLNPTRTALLEILEMMGARVTRVETGVEAGEPVGDVTVTGGDTLRGLEMLAPLWWGFLPRMIDEVPALAMAAAQASGVTRIEGAEELRVKETDRLAALADGLRQVGIEAEESAAGLAIQGGTVRGGTVDARGDHRIAMAFAVLGTMAAAPITITGTREIGTSYPDFVATLRALGGRVEVDEEDVLAR